MFNKISREKIDKIKNMRISTSTIVDILDGFCSGQVLSPALYAINVSDFYLVSQAYTVQWKIVRKGSEILKKQASTWDQVSKFLVPEIKSAEGLIYVAGSGEFIQDAALAGGMSCTYFEKIGFSGVILGGAVRDIKELKELNIPIIATNVTPSDTQGAYWVSETGTSCLIDHVTVNSGDLIIADPNGTVIIPLNLVDSVINKAVEINNTENSMLEKIKRGERLPDLINITGRI